MPVKVQVPPNLRPHTDNKGVVELEGATVGAVLEALHAAYPATAGKVIDKGSLRRTLNVFLNNEDIRVLGGLAAPVKDGDDLAVIPTVSGGEDDEDDGEEEGDDVPEGAAIFPAIPAELGVSPLLLSSVHAMVFLGGSEAAIVNPEAAHEAIGQMAEYLQRLRGPELVRVQEDMATLEGYARRAKWPKGLVLALKGLLEDLGVGGDAPPDDGEDDEE